MEKRTLSVGLMLFALFFGAGNLIFPPALGQAAGDKVWLSMAGFFITGVGLPLLGVIALARVGGGLHTLTERVNPLFGSVFAIVLYLAIGPFFGIPRTGTVAFEMAALPFLPEGINTGLPLFIFTIVFFAITYWLALNPSKLVDRIGNILTPVLLFIIGSVLVKALITPVGKLGNPTPEYEASPLVKGFMDGYLTMDTLGALAFGIVVITAVKTPGMKKENVTKMVIKAGVIAAVCLAAVYGILAYLGATSQSLGKSENGGQILTNVVYQLFGETGNLLLGLAVALACLTTSVGLVTATGEFAQKRFPKLSYKGVILALSIFSAAVSNVGLSQLISISVPVLTAIYPVAIVLILLSFLHDAFSGRQEVYLGAIIATALISIADGLKAFGLNLGTIDQIYSHIPMYADGIGWLIPAIIGAIVGFIIALVRGRIVIFST
ncbi:branched-chain amino acid transport system II carrier protein [Fictibacillus phosphorivorans]|uniref:branched-chain amino acid transport system II carrier protein n=1 Tax=Fictibacillus phosphorivorans TaxID=1221500 RepID=UPI002041F90A|nr:branched-chain amino acid transport system II carrier protein [Fictibacillus phosphorivorans]MCM3718213.1 branched-chain amino acid transport system II carrier protein [Fictibacillus phosphorivorans]MCM3775920.1 branched-chain amino acid transport system II carrier protein [Fictibacillus phosphorivorans]